MCSGGLRIANFVKSVCKYCHTAIKQTTKTVSGAAIENHQTSKRILGGVEFKIHDTDSP